MNAKEFVDSMFEAYEQTAALADFKEELLANLNAKVESFIKKGMDQEAAFSKASAELGDVSALADDLSLKKRTEVFEEMYMDIRKYMKPGRVAAYVVFGAIAVFGIIIGLIAFFAVRNLDFELYNFKNFNLRITALFGCILPFLLTSAVGLTYLGVTQETASSNPVSKKRGIWYAVSAGLIFFGIWLMPMLFFGVKLANNVSADITTGMVLSDKVEIIIPILVSIIPFILPGAGILVFLCLTEKNRYKPWAKTFHKNAIEQEKAIWQDQAFSTRFGLFSGALWMSAVGLFFLLGYLLGFNYSWLIFIFIIPVQLMIQAKMTKKNQPSCKREEQS